MKGRYFADLFGGSGGVSNAVAGLGFASKVWELKCGPEFDLTRRVVQERLCRDIKGKRVMSIMLAPPCSSFSTARDRTMTIRSPEFPWGLPGLPAPEQDKVDRGNACLRACLRFVRVAHKKKVPWILENPAGSRMWYTRELQLLSRLGGVECVECDFCQFGTKWRKRTRFLIGNCDSEDLQCLRRRCEGPRGRCGRTGRPHLQLTGANKHGIPWTKIAEPYPSELNRTLAKILTESERHHHIRKSWRNLFKDD